METPQAVLQSDNPDSTEKFAETIGKNLRGGEVIELISDLGGGKTTFTRGIARGAGSEDVVASPTFTISKVYSTSTFDIHHFDFYRLPDAGLAAHELEDLVGDPGIVVIVEWGGAVGHVLPEGKVTIEINKTSEVNRQLVITCPGNMRYLLEGIA